ncbi:MAG: glycosyltransferase family 2 protein [Candidatus Omnitrophica bacterium]|nr:glycosyltransferase family 2 protein [Candidatus Omnitrophota bacterium]
MKENQNKAIKNKSISVIIPALNEEKNLEVTTKMVRQAVEKRFDEYEVFIYDDGSTDNTGIIANRIARNDNHFKVIQHKKPKCIGKIYKEGVKLAKMNYVILINGKCDINQYELDKIFKLVGTADMIIPYTLNLKERAFARIVISKIFASILNILFGLKLKYYNHFVLHKREIINSINIKTDSYAFQAEALIKLIKKGYSYIEIGIVDRFEKGIKTKAFSFQNVFLVLVFFVIIIFEIYFKKRKNF